MNKVLILVFCALLIGAKSMDVTTFPKALVGKWEGPYDISYHFKANGNCEFRQGVGGAFAKAKADSSKNPMWLDITMRQGQMVLTTPCLVEVLHRDTLKIEQFGPVYSEDVPESRRPKVFTHPDSLAIPSAQHVVWRVE